MGLTFNPFTGTLDFTGTGGGGSGTPAAPDTSVQFNDGGSFGGDAALTWDSTDKELTLIANTGGSSVIHGTGPAGSPNVVNLYLDDAGFTQITANSGNGQLAQLGIGDSTAYLELHGAESVIRTGTVDAQTLVLQARDVDGAAYAIFATLTNGNTPSLTIAEPAGGSLLILPPTSDPHVAGALWNNSGLAVISSG